MNSAPSIPALNERIISCTRCPRLADYTRQVARDRVRRFSDQEYWGRPLPGFGDVNARLLLVGLAPAAHGGNRTGRMFTGDSSGDWVAKVLYENGFASSPRSVSVGDGLKLRDAYVTAAVRCAPPGNRPTRTEFDNCAPYLTDELALLRNLRVILCLGRMAFNVCGKLLGFSTRGFAHGASLRHGHYIILCSYHPSRQNTQTGRLTWDMWNAIFMEAARLLYSEKRGAESARTASGPTPA